jgi:hypothetical protein
MGNDWGELERGGKPRWWLIFLLVGILIIVIVRWSPSTVDAPKTITDRPLQALSSASQSPGVQIPRPERSPHKPASQGVVIYVVDTGISPVWGLESAISGWKKARWTDFRLIASCIPLRPCVTVAEKSLAKDEAGQTNFSYKVEETTIYLNSAIIWEPFVAQSTLAHEMGHVLGAPHIAGTNNTLMTAKDGFYRTQPTALDLQIVDALGPWELEKMYESSGKTVDVRTAPK